MLIIISYLICSLIATLEDKKYKAPRVGFFAFCFAKKVLATEKKVKTDVDIDYLLSNLKFKTKIYYKILSGRDNGN